MRGADHPPLSRRLHVAAAQLLGHAEAGEGLGGRAQRELVDFLRDCGEAARTLERAALRAPAWPRRLLAANDGGRPRRSGRLP